ncbi:unnamed protein product, partial [Caenorhabditis brenneri]
DQRDMAFEQKNWRAVFAISKAINKKVEEWNERFPKGPTYLDLHWMTARGAIDYVARMTHGSGRKWMIETGQGRHSVGGEPKIKNELLEIYGEYIRIHEKNPGKLVLDLR